MLGVDVLLSALDCGSVTRREAAVSLTESQVFKVLFHSSLKACPLVTPLSVTCCTVLTRLVKMYFDLLKKQEVTVWLPTT